MNNNTSAAVQFLFRLFNRDPRDLQKNSFMASRKHFQSRDKLERLNMKDTATHRKRHKSESESVKTTDHKDSHHKAGSRASQHSSQKHGGHHQKGDHGHKGDRGHGHHNDHGHHQDHDGDHHQSSASSHPIRPRRDTMMSRAHSTHHESDRRSTGTGEMPSPVVFYENTYKLIPDCKINEGKVRNIIHDVFRENIKEEKYDPAICGAKCKLLSEIIKERIKHLNMDRFKIISMVMIGQKFDQSMLVTSRCLWHHRFDNSISVEFKLGDIVAIGLVFVVYAE